MLSQLVQVVLPVFGVAAAGWMAARFLRLELETLTDVVLYLAAPALVFHSLASRTPSLQAIGIIGGGAAAQIAVCGLVAWGTFAALRIRERRGLLLAAMFPNTGNLGLPLALFAFGQDGLAAAVIVFTAVTVLHYSLGLMVVSGRPHPAEAFTAPLFHAAVLGAAASLTGWLPPAPVMRGLELLGEAAVPLMLLSLGIRIRSVRLHAPARALLTVVLRMVPGLAAALAWVVLLDVQDPARGVLLVTGVLPSAVMNFVLAEAHHQQGDEVAGAILLGTALSVAVIPLVLAFLA